MLVADAASIEIGRWIIPNFGKIMKAQHASHAVARKHRWANRQTAASQIKYSNSNSNSNNNATVAQGEAHRASSWC